MLQNYNYPHVGDRKTKPFRFSGYHHVTELSLEKPGEISNTKWFESGNGMQKCSLKAKHEEKNPADLLVSLFVCCQHEEYKCLVLGFCVWRVQVCLFSQILPPSWQVWTQPLPPHPRIPAWKKKKKKCQPDDFYTEIHRRFTIISSLHHVVTHCQHGGNNPAYATATNRKQVMILIIVVDIMTCISPNCKLQGNIWTNRKPNIPTNHIQLDVDIYRTIVSYHCYLSEQVSW